MKRFVLWYEQERLRIRTRLHINPTNFIVPVFLYIHGVWGIGTLSVSVIVDTPFSPVCSAFSTWHSVVEQGVLSFLD